MAAARLYDDHVDAVHALVARRVGTQRAPDVTAEVFEQAVRTWDRFDEARGTERLFLFGTAVAVIRRHPKSEREHLLTLRSAKAPARDPDDPLVSGVTVVSADDEPAPVETGRTPDEDAVVEAVVNLLPDDRDVLLLSTWEQCSNSAIGEALDLSSGTVRSTLNRVRKQLKAAVAAAAERRATSDPGSGPESRPGTDADEPADASTEAGDDGEGSS